MAKAQRLIIADYNGLENRPIINANLPVATPVENTYYLHTGATGATFTHGIIYKYANSGYAEIGTGASVDLSKYIQASSFTGLDTTKQYALVYSGANNLFALQEVEGEEGGAGWLEASTPQEADALLIEANIGKFFMYLGESYIEDEETVDPIGFDFYKYAMYQIVQEEEDVVPAMVYIGAEDIETSFTDLMGMIEEKQDVLIGEGQGQNIKTINGQSILGSGNLDIGGGSGGTSDYNQLNNRPIIEQDLDAIGFTPVDNTYYKHKGEALLPFYVGQVVANGDKIHLDTTKAEELVEYLAGLDTYVEVPESGGMRYKATLATFTTDDGQNESPLILAYKVDGTAYDVTGYIYELDFNLAAVFVSESITSPETGELIEAGFQNLDTNGDLTITGMADEDTPEIATINNTVVVISGENVTWNGNFIGKASQFIDGVIYLWDGNTFIKVGNDSNGFYNATMAMPAGAPEKRVAESAPDTVDIVKGYKDGKKFYADADHQVEITGESGVYYLDITNSSAVDAYTYNDDYDEYESASFMYTGLELNTTQLVDFSNPMLQMKLQYDSKWKRRQDSQWKYLNYPVIKCVASDGSTFEIVIGYMPAGTYVGGELITEDAWSLLYAIGTAGGGGESGTLYTSTTVDGISGWRVGSSLESYLSSLSYFADDSDGDSLQNQLPGFVESVLSVNGEWTITPATIPSMDIDNIDTNKELAPGDLVIDNLGNLSKITGKSTREYEIKEPLHPIEVGDVISQLYFDTDSVIEFSAFDFSNAIDGASIGLPGAQVINLIGYPAFMAIWFPAGASIYGTTFTEDCYALRATLVNYPLYVTDELVPLVDMDEPGWFSPAVAAINEVLAGSPITVETVDQQNVWGAYISKDGQWGESETITVNTVTYDRVHSLALKSDIKKPIYSEVLGAPVIQLSIDEIEGIIDDSKLESYAGKYIQPTSNVSRDGIVLEQGIIYYCDGEKFEAIKGGSGGGDLPDYSNANDGDVLRVSRSFIISGTIEDGDTVNDLWTNPAIDPDLDSLEYSLEPVWSDSEATEPTNYSIAILMQGTSDVVGSGTCAVASIEAAPGIYMLGLLVEEVRNATTAWGILPIFYYLPELIASSMGVDAGWNAEFTTVDDHGFVNLMYKPYDDHAHYSLSNVTVNQFDIWSTFMGPQVVEEDAQLEFGSPFPEVKKNDTVLVANCTEYPLNNLATGVYNNIEVPQQGQIYFNTALSYDEVNSLIGSLQGFIGNGGGIAVLIEGTPQFAIRFAIANGIYAIYEEYDWDGSSSFIEKRPIYASESATIDGVTYSGGWENVDSCTWSASGTDDAFIQGLHTDFAQYVPAIGKLITTIEGMYYGDVADVEVHWTGLKTINGESLIGDGDFQTPTLYRHNIVISTNASSSGADVRAYLTVYNTTVEAYDNMSGLLYDGVCQYMTSITGYKTSGKDPYVLYAAQFASNSYKFCFMPKDDDPDPTTYYVQATDGDTISVTDNVEQIF